MSGTLPAVYFDGVIDVSHHNGVIDWPAVAASGIALTFIKASQGSSYVDPQFAVNRTAALAAGIMVVPYHFLDSTSADEQAKHFLSVTGAQRGEPLMLDWEPNTVAGGGGTAMAAQLVAMGRATLAATGIAPVTYYGYSMLAAADPDLSKWPLMLPAYPKGTASGDYKSLVSVAPHLPPGRPASRPYDFHQYTASGKVSGITGSVDRSIWVGALAELRQWFGGGTAAPAAVVPQPSLPPTAPAQPPVAVDLPRQAKLSIPPGIAALQSLLTTAGFNPGPVDGLIDPREGKSATIKALLAYAQSL